MFNHPLPINFTWFTSANGLEISSSDKEKLLDSGSLTARLKSQYSEFSVSLLNLEKVTDSHTECLESDTFEVPFWCREVLLYGDGVARVYAQSWMNQDAVELGMREIGETPLGELLFQSPQWQRGEIQIAEICGHTDYIGLLNHLGLSQKKLYARQSDFTNGAAKVRVCEVFLPNG